MAKEAVVQEVFPEATEVAPEKPATHIGFEGLFPKLVRVMAAVGYVPKRGRNNFHKYDYATEADVAAEVRAALINERVLFVPSMKSIATRHGGEGGKQTITQVVMSYRLIDADTGETLEYDMPGEGADSLDKGPYKAITGSEKYALMKLLLIPTGDDPEKDGEGDEGGSDAAAPPPEPAPPKAAPAPSRGSRGNACTAGQVKLLYARLKAANVRPEALCAKFNIDEVEGMPFGKVNEALAWIAQDG